mmetsp:Transcript_49352/g.88154  ORF Transcript_49352/g.88154 Transcript_49352/m.88154 type:complete len:1099 (-) Transcript_49352:220-3516(-)
MAAAPLGFIAQAAMAGDMATVSDWVEGHNQVNIPLDKDGNSALHFCAKSPSTEDVLLLLLGSAADPNARNHRQETPLHWACENQAVECVRALLHHGADPSCLTLQQKTCVDLATDPAVLDELHQYKSSALPAAAPPAVPDGFERRSPVASETVSSNELTPGFSSIHSTPRGEYREEREPQGSPTESKAWHGSPVRSQRTAASPPRATASRPRERTSQTSLESEGTVRDLQSQVSVLQNKTLALESTGRAAAETKKRLDEALRAKVDLELRLQQKQIELDDYKCRAEARDKMLREKEQAERLNAVEALEADQLHLQSELRRLVDRLEHETEEKMIFKAQLEVKTSAHLETQSSLRAVRADKARLEVHVANLEPLKGVVADLQQQTSLLKLDVESLEGLKPALSEMASQKAQLECQLRDTANQVLDLQSQVAVLQTRAADAETRLQQETVHAQALEDRLRTVEREKARLTAMQEQLEKREREKAAEDDCEERREPGDGQAAGPTSAPSDWEQLQSGMDALQEERGELIAKVHVYEQQVTHLKSQVDALRDEKQTLSAKAAQVLGLQGRLQATEHDLQQAQEELAKGMQALDSQKGEIRQLQREKATAQETLKEMMRFQDLYESVQQEKTAVESELSAKAMELSDVKEALRETTKGRQALQRECAEADQQVLMMERDISSLQRELRKALEDLTRARHQHKVQEQEKGGQSLEREQLQLRLTDTQGENLRLLGQMKQLQEELSMAQGEAQRHKTDNEVYLARLEQSHKDAEARWAKQHQQKQELEETVSELREELQRERVTGLVEVPKLKTEVQRLKETQEQLRADRERAVRELEDTQTFMHEEMDKNRHRLALMHQERQGLELQMKALKDQASLTAGVGGGVAPTRGLLTPLVSHRDARDSHRDTDRDRYRDMDRDRDRDRYRFNGDEGRYHDDALRMRAQSPGSHAGSVRSYGRPPLGMNYGPVSVGTPGSLHDLDDHDGPPPERCGSVPGSRGSVSSEPLAPLRAPGKASEPLAPVRSTHRDHPSPQPSGHPLLDDLHAPVPKPSLGSLKEDERRLRMGAASGLRQTGVAMAKNRALLAKASEAEAFFAAHRKISSRHS